MTAGTLAGLTIRAALVLGFGLTLGLWLFAGYDFTRHMAEVQTQAATINQRYMHAQELLSTVRVQVLLGSVYVRDGLLDPDPRTTEDYRRHVRDSFRAVDRALQHYVPVIDSRAERERIGRLQRELNDLQSTILDVLATDRGRWAADARLLLRRVLPKRELAIRVSEEVQALNRAAFVQQQAALAKTYAVSQRRVWWRLGLALTASLGIALLATLYAGRLEDRLRRQSARDVQNARDLQRLSTKLINAQEDERRNVARELHDEVGQALMAIKVELAVAQRAIEAAAGPAHLLRDAEALTDGALHTVRDLSHLLHPSLLDDLGLTAAIDWYFRGFGKRHGIRVDLLHERMDERLVPETEAAVYRIVQEALTNVAKHAQATTCRIYLQRLPNTLLITIEDDGTGFDVEGIRRAGAPRGLGLIGIRERVAQLRGTLRLESAPGKGTRLTVELPAHVRAQPADVDEIEPSGSGGEWTESQVIRG
jgi:signal transduction histidine kinase